MECTEINEREYRDPRLEAILGKENLPQIYIFLLAISTRATVLDCGFGQGFSHV